MSVNFFYYKVNSYTAGHIYGTVKNISSFGSSDSLSNIKDDKYLNVLD